VAEKRLSTSPGAHQAAGDIAVLPGFLMRLNELDAGENENRAAWPRSNPRMSFKNTCRENISIYPLEKTTALKPPDQLCGKTSATAAILPMEVGIVLQTAPLRI